MVKLFVLVSDGGDGSYYPCYTMDESLIELLQKMHDEDILDYESGYSDGDGFHYSVVNLPEGTAPESLGVRMIDGEYWRQYYQNWVKEYGDEEEDDD